MTLSNLGGPTSVSSHGLPPLAAPGTPLPDVEFPADPVDTVTLGGPAFTTGNQVDTLVGGAEIFPAVHEAIGGAKANLRVEMYEFGQDEIADHLAQKAREGVDVRLVLDPATAKAGEGTAEAPGLVARMREAGVKVLTYPVKSGQIDHIKLITVDGKRAIIGGMNWGKHSPQNRDVDVDIQGPAVQDLEKEFGRDWQRSGGDAMAPGEDAPARGEAAVRAVATREDARDVLPAVLENIRGAKERVHVEMFSLTQKDVVEALVEAKQRGVDVRVIVDQASQRRTNSTAVEALKAGGVAVRWYQGDHPTAKLHAKAGHFDRDRSTLGSANWTNKGTRINRELDVDIRDRGTTEELHRMFEQDWQNSSVPA